MRKNDYEERKAAGKCVRVGCKRSRRRWMGAGRKKQVGSKWDTLHPGRGLASDLPANPTSRAELEKMIADLSAGKDVPIVSTLQAVMEDEEPNE